MDTKTNNEHWNDYWSQGHKTSFGSAFTNCYEGVIKTTWVQYFNTLKTNSRVLDLCTGNASLLRLAKSCLNEDNNIHFTGVDYADINTSDGFAKLSNINLMFNVNIEQLPFEADSFDYVISNFGIEYSNLNKSLAEASRVLIIGGKVELVCHCHDSTIIKSNADELAMLNLMLSEGNVLDNLKALIKALVVREKNKRQASASEQESYQEACQSAEKFRHKLNDNIAIIDNSFTKALHESEFLAFLKYLLSKQCQDKETTLRAFKLSMQAHNSRLSAMINAALSKTLLTSISELLRENGLSLLNIKDVVNEDGKIACQISAKKHT